MWHKFITGNHRKIKVRDQRRLPGGSVYADPSFGHWRKDSSSRGFSTGKDKKQ